MIVVDTGPLVAAANRNDRHHRRSVAALQEALPPRLVSPPVVAEVCYLLGRDAGPSVEAAFLRSFRTGFLSVAELLLDDLTRAADLVERYSDLPLGGVDACVVALAERVGAKEIITLDVRHFSVVRPTHVAAFTLRP